MRDPGIRRLEAEALQSPKLPPASAVLKGGFELIFVINLLVLMGAVTIGVSAFAAGLLIHSVVELFQFGWSLIPNL